MNSNEATNGCRHSRQTVQPLQARRRNRTVTHPVIRLSGLYLERYGFNIHDQVDITCEQGKIEIKKLTPGSSA